MDGIGYKYSYKNIDRRLTSLSVYNVGYQKCDRDQPWGPGLRDHYLIHHVVSGKGSYSVFGKVYQISAGETFLAFPDTTISYSPDENDPWEYYWVGFNGSDARNLLHQTDFSRQSPVISTDFGDDLRELLLQIYQNRGSQPHEQARMAGGLYLFLAYLMEHSTSLVTRGEPSSGYLRYALDYVAGNYSRNISVEDIAQSSGISRSGLYRAFMKHLGVSPVRYLTNFRMEQACTLLRRSDLSVEAVACSVGFEDALYFSRVFKSHMGVSPRKYSRDELPSEPTEL
ncbi:MAG: AraC family transcriptional regulator [Angelakisella sp.]